MSSVVVPLHQHLWEVLLALTPLALLPSITGGCFCATGYLLGIK